MRLSHAASPNVLSLQPKNCSPSEKRTTPTGDFADMRILIGIASLVLLSAFTGSGLALRYGILPHRPEHVHTSLFLAAAPPLDRTQDAVNARTDERILILAEQEQSARDDRKLLHEDIYNLTMQEKNHFDSLHEQISIDESWLHGSTAFIGIGLTVLNSIALFTQLIDRKRRHRHMEIPQ
jgi:hypothetical protein